eukprot:COSAG04_NODE_6387_length_1340_cov_1.975020_2_plen_76_part_01
MASPANMAALRTRSAEERAAAESARRDEAAAQVEEAAIAAELAKRVKDWSPEGTSVSIARAGSGRLAIGFADAFDI